MHSGSIATQIEISADPIHGTWLGSPKSVRPADVARVRMGMNRPNSYNDCFAGQLPQC
jgi:hypothetical protein